MYDNEAATVTSPDKINATGNHKTFTHRNPSRMSSMLTVCDTFTIVHEAMRNGFQVR